MHTVRFDKPNEHVTILSPGFVRADIVFGHSVFLWQIEVQCLCYQYVKACLLCIYCATLFSTDLITHSRQGQEWIKVRKIHFSPHDSLQAAKFQVFRLSKGKAFLVTRLGSNAAAVAYSQNNNKSCWISCRVFIWEQDPVCTPCSAGVLAWSWPIEKLFSSIQANLLLRCFCYFNWYVWQSHSSQVINNKGSDMELNFFLAHQ